MAYDRPSWKEIDRKRDSSSGKRGQWRGKDKNGLRENSTRYDKYKADLNRLFDQGLAGELIKKDDKEDSSQPEQQDVGAADKKGKTDKTGKTILRRKSEGRIPKNKSRAASRLKLVRIIIDAQDPVILQDTIGMLVKRFGMPDDWEVLVRVLEHPDEELVGRAVEHMVKMLPNTDKVPRRASLKERLRSIGQTADDFELRQQAEDLESKL